MEAHFLKRKGGRTFGPKRKGWRQSRFVRPIALIRARAAKSTSVFPFKEMCFRGCPSEPPPFSVSPRSQNRNSASWFVNLV